MSQPIRNMGSSKVPKYRVNRKVMINTCDISHPCKKIDEYSSSKMLEISEQHSSKRPTPAEQFRKNIYDAIKVEIKKGLRREYDRRRQKERMNIKMIDSFKPKNIRASSYHQQDSRKLRSKVKLPSLGTNMYIITTSTRILQKT